MAGSYTATGSSDAERGEQRDVGVLQQRAARRAVRRVQRDADRGREVDREVGLAVGLAERVEHAECERDRLGCARAGSQTRNWVSVARATSRVAGERAQARADVVHQAIADARGPWS